MNRLIIIGFVLFLVVNTNATATNINPNRAKIEQLLDICIYSAQNTPHNKNCGNSGMQVINDNPKDIGLLWDYAQIVRRKMGNAASLEYYELALSRNYSKERCFDDGLDVAVNWGLEQPIPKYGKEVQHALRIVFEQCWKEWREDIVTRGKRKTTGNWTHNVCLGLKQFEQLEIIDTCK